MYACIIAEVVCWRAYIIEDISQAENSLVAVLAPLRGSVAFAASAFFLQVIKANDDLTPEHHQFFLYQMLRGLKYIHTGTFLSGNLKHMRLEQDTCLCQLMPKCQSLGLPDACHRAPQLEKPHHSPSSTSPGVQTRHTVSADRVRHVVLQPKCSTET